jgi:hypothetical protein
MACDVSSLVTAAIGNRLSALDDRGVMLCCAGLLSSNLGAISANTAMAQAAANNFYALSEQAIDEAIMALLCAANVAPDPPSNLVGFVVLWNCFIAWQNNATNATSIQVWLSVNGAAATLIATLAATATTYQDSIMHNFGDLLCYTVRACNATSCSVFSNQFCDTI